ncbi:hypothetical protein RCL_jg13848.t1 [Rhizophagus clarus]|uniref:Uncharacterized protein n=1 Tax=Rhizophagus clarus TaxID=94130 RepID=A0A8H3LSC0_9GLOM|nr:hypothetical protein RCL_jg13848.t1 [Rhizophagus clarus]
MDGLFLSLSFCSTKLLNVREAKSQLRYGHLTLEAWITSFRSLLDSRFPGTYCEVYKRKSFFTIPEL